MNWSPAIFKVKRRNRARSAGFTLVEVLCAILVLAITIPALVEAYITAGNVAAYSRQRVEALMVGQSALDELVATGDWNGGAMSGAETPGPVTYQWSAELQTWGDAATENTNMQQLTMTVSWHYSQQDFTLTLDTLVYTPDPDLTDGTTTGTTATGGLLQ